MGRLCQTDGLTEDQQEILKAVRTFVEEICHEVMFEAPERRGETVVIDAATARKRLERFDGIGRQLFFVGTTGIGQ